MWFIDNIVSYCNSISGFFYDIYLKVLGWAWPLWEAAWLFYGLSSLFADLAWGFYYFGQWVDGIASQLTDILSWSTIQSYLLSWLPNLDDVNLWFYGWWSNVTSAITSWWSSTSLTVQSWIDIAKSLLQDQINSINSSLAGLQSQISTLLDQIPSINEILAWFTDWWGNVLVNLTTWWDDRLIDITGLIDSALISYAPFWEGWQDWKDSVIEFIQDPWQWLYDRAEDLFERFW